MAKMKSNIFLMHALIVAAFFSCKSNKNKNATWTKKFIESTIDFAIKNKHNKSIELPFIYDSLARKIPEQADEKSILADILKKKGFKVVSWGRGNYSPRGPRIISMILQKEDCFCEVNKIYYSTPSDTLYEIAERIRCTDSLTMQKKTGSN